jgi:hypothetical protein
MQDVIIGVRGTLSSTGAEDIDLLVHSHNVGNPSPCHVFENSAYRGMIGGCVASLDQIFDLQASKHKGFAVKQRSYYLTTITPRPEELEQT